MKKILLIITVTIIIIFAGYSLVRFYNSQNEPWRTEKINVLANGAT